MVKYLSIAREFYSCILDPIMTLSVLSRGGDGTVNTTVYSACHDANENSYVVFILCTPNSLSWGVKRGCSCLSAMAPITVEYVCLCDNETRRACCRVSLMSIQRMMLLRLTDNYCFIRTKYFLQTIDWRYLGVLMVMHVMFG